MLIKNEREIVKFLPWQIYIYFANKHKNIGLRKTIDFLRYIFCSSYILCLWVTYTTIRNATRVSYRYLRHRICFFLFPSSRFIEVAIHFKGSIIACSMSYSVEEIVFLQGETYRISLLFVGFFLFLDSILNNLFTNDYPKKYIVRICIHICMCRKSV